MPTDPSDYARIALDIIAAIDAGDLRPGDRLPTHAQMAAQYETSTSTVKMALAYLDGAGRIRRRQGKGVYVA